MTEQLKLKWATAKQVKEAAEELKAIIRAKYPEAEFVLSRAPDDQHVWLLWTFVDIDDPEEVRELTDDWEFELLEEKKKKHTILLYASEWEDAASARQMFDAYRHILMGKWKTMHPKKESEGLLVGEGDDGYFRLQLAGTRLTSIEGMKTLSAVTDIR